MQTGSNDLASVGTGKWGRDQVNRCRRISVDLFKPLGSSTGRLGRVGR
jgi:hypothetical protein